MVHAQSNTRGRLFVVATPIGNLQDITLRSLQCLDQVSVVVCEHIQRTQLLFEHHNLIHTNKTFVKLANGREDAPTQRILEILASGIDVALVSDAGTPLVSDPGFPLVRESHQQNIAVIPLPGASALTALVSACPIPLSSFQFVGFVSVNQRRFRSKLEQIVDTPQASIFYVSPRDFDKVLTHLCDAGCGDRRVFVGREISKLYETFWFDRCSDLLAQPPDLMPRKGEFTCVLEGHATATLAKNTELLLNELLGTDLSVKTISDIVASVTGVKRREVYERIQAIKLTSDRVN